MASWATVLTLVVAPLTSAGRFGPPGGIGPAKPAAAAWRLTTAPGGDPLTGAAAKQPDCDVTKLPAAGATVAAPGTTTKVTQDGATVAVTPGAVAKPTTITAVSVCDADLPPLDQGMANVTKGPRRGYRFLPHQTFGANMSITLPFDTSLIPAGMSLQDVSTYYYDVSAKKWQPLDRVSIDPATTTVTSTTNHFTDFIDATITVPDHPGAFSDNPTSLKDIKAADPGANVGLIAAPSATSDGSAHLSYPITLPKGRRGQAPDLSLSYDSSWTDGSSGPADGWLGLGWDLALPSVTVNTQWGVPRYDANSETETYMVGGGELTPVANRGPLVPRSAEKVFHSRVEGTFLKIVRHGIDPKSYWWEVTAKDGTRQFYGGDPTMGPDPAACPGPSPATPTCTAGREPRSTQRAGNRLHLRQQRAARHQARRAGRVLLRQPVLHRPQRPDSHQADHHRRRADRREAGGPRPDRLREEPVLRPRRPGRQHQLHHRGRRQRLRAPRVLPRRPDLGPGEEHQHHGPVPVRREVVRP